METTGTGPKVSPPGAPVDRSSLTIVPSSTPSFSASRALNPTLLLHLIDDAAVFPPGNAPLRRAVAEHRRHRSSSYAAAIGPLLVPVADAATIADLAADRSLAVGLIARPGTPRQVIEEGVALLRVDPTVRVSGLELGWVPQWRAFDVAGIPLTLEVPRGPDHDRALDDVAQARAAALPAQVKFRTGATPTLPWPTERELAEFITGAVSRGLPFKLTGGLHHLLRADHDGGRPEHGLLNVLLATQRAVTEPNRVDEVESVLAERDPLAVVPVLERWKPAQIEAVRSAFTAYGCCGVTDPLTELDAMGLLPADLATDLPHPDER